MAPTPSRVRAVGYDSVALLRRSELAMNPKKNKRSDLTLVVYFALGGLLLVLVGLGVAAHYSGAVETQMVYEGFN